MPRLRAANNVSSDELIQLVTVLSTEGELPEVEPEVKAAGSSNREQAQANEAKAQLNAALIYLKQFSARRVQDSLEEVIADMNDRKEPIMDWLIRKRVEMLKDEKTDFGKLRILAWIEGLVRAVATSHVKAQERLCIRKPEGSLGNSVGNGSPFANLLRERQAAKGKHGAGKDLAGKEAFPPC